MMYTCPKCSQGLVAGKLDLDDKVESYIVDFMCQKSLAGLALPSDEIGGECVLEMMFPCPECLKGELLVKVWAEVHFEVNECYVLDEITELYCHVTEHDAPLEDLLSCLEEEAYWKRQRDREAEYLEQEQEAAEEEAARQEAEKEELKQEIAECGLEKWFAKNLDWDKVTEGGYDVQEEENEQTAHVLQEEEEMEECDILTDYGAVKERGYDTQEANEQKDSLICRTYFTFGGGVHPRLILTEAIVSAKRRIDILMYIFSDPNLARTLEELKAPDVEVRIIVDASQQQEQRQVRATLHKLSKFCKIRLLGGKPGTSKGSMHHKAMIVDNEKVCWGSYNYSYAASALSWEDLTTTNHPPTVSSWVARFKHLWNNAH